MRRSDTGPPEDRSNLSLRKRMTDVEQTLFNGYGARIKFIERMQWWQIGLLVALVGGFAVGLWTMYREDRQEYREVRSLLLEHTRRPDAASAATH